MRHSVWLTNLALLVVIGVVQSFCMVPMAVILLRTPLGRRMRAMRDDSLAARFAAKEAVHFMGMPEGNTALAQAAIYLSTAPKSNAVYEAYNRAAEDAHHDVAQPVPLHLRNAPTRLMKELEYGKGYKYAHSEADAVADMSCLPSALEGRKYYEPRERGFEKEIKRRLDGWEEIKKKRKG